MDSQPFAAVQQEGACRPSRCWRSPRPEGNATTSPTGIDTPLLRDRIVALNTDPAKLGVTRQDTFTTGDNRGSTQGD
jgi:hypothetical protein